MTRTHRLRRFLILAPLVAGLVSVSTVAAASFLSTGAGAAPASSTSVNAPEAPTVLADGTTATISWPTVTLANGAPVDGYRVLRHDGDDVREVCTAAAPATTCVDDAPLTLAEYGVVAFRAGWTGPESPLTELTVANDTTAPVTTISATGGQDGAWAKQPVAVTVAATDADSGVKEIHYILNGGPPVVVPGNQVNLEISDDGLSSLEAWAVDHAGNEETPHKTSTVRVDRTAPTGLSISPASSTTIWRSSSLVTLSATDSLSGLAGFRYAVDSGAEQTLSSPATSFTLSEGQHTVTYRAFDVAGNETPASTATIRVDAQGPSVTNVKPVQGSTYNGNNWVNNTCAGAVCATVTDPGSGVQSVTYTLTTGSGAGALCWNGSAFVAGPCAPNVMTLSGTTWQGTAIDRSHLQTGVDRTYTLTIVARDVAGHSSQSVVTFTAK